ncbi:ABC transporter permease [Thalassospira alkalitolerans]|uniref:ABC transporter permease n=1 Tax=Thalassospira alkalitolerans TaxID=1293890 RepID=UPI003AA952F1
MKNFWQQYSRNKSAVFGLTILLALILLALLANVLFPADPFKLLGKPMEPPSTEFLLGTDSLGRSVASGIAHGARTSLLIGLVATSVAVLLGTVIGGLAGFHSGKVDNLLMRLTELFQTIPSFIFAVLLVAILSPSLKSVVIAIAVVSWPTVARLVRAEFLSLRKREFVQAAITMGMPSWKIILQQILPNALSPIIVSASLMIATAILLESGLSFLGLGDPNIMSWGFLIGSGRSILRTAWWVCTFPGIAILLTVMAINLVGEGLNDVLNPRLREKDE